MERLSQEKILAVFDQLVAEDVIVYGPHEIVEQDCEGFPLEFRICPSLLKKPHTVGAKLDSNFNKDRKWGPGSDLYDVDDRLKIAKLNNGTHDLALNLFCVDRPQFLMPTTDSYRRQHEPMDEADFEAALSVLRTLEDIYVIFNCGEAAGCSRSHKHLQGLLGPPRAFESFVGGAEKESKIPFVHFSHHFASGFEKTRAADILAIYEDFIAQAKDALHVPRTDATCPHNVVLWKDWIIVVPRRTAAVEAASANAAGMLGSSWVPERSEVDEWLRLGCRKVLVDLGVPR